MRRPVILAAVLFLLLSCEEETGSSAALYGVWVSEFLVQETGEKFVTQIDVSQTKVKYHGSYEAEIVNSPDFYNEYGYLILKFTKYADFGGEPSTTHANTGKYGALYWKDLAPASVYLADAYTGYTHELKTSYEEAVAAFTNNAAATFVNWSITSPYAKKSEYPFE
jgi:hypothetical protein